MIVKTLKELLEKYPDDMEVGIEAPLNVGFIVDEVRSNGSSVLIYSSYVVSLLEDALGEDL